MASRRDSNSRSGPKAPSAGNEPSAPGRRNDVSGASPGVSLRRPVTVAQALPGSRALDLLIRPTRAEVSLRALKHNYEVAVQAAGGAGIIAVVKANAYGHGGVHVARALESWGVRMLGVALVEEAIELRHVGIRSPILVLGGNYEKGYGLLVEYELTPTIFREEHLLRLSEAARAAGRPVSAHLKVDTGMSRLGIPWEGVASFLEKASVFPDVKLEGMLTQLAKADDLQSDLTDLQLQRFHSSLEAARRAGVDVKFRHVSNSAALMRLPPEARKELNLVRPGLLLYGLSPGDSLIGHTALRPVMSWKTGVTFVQALPRGRTVSYGATWTAPRDCVIATLPVGYADGYRRSYSNKAQVLIRGRRANVVGRVCMDMIMVDVTDIPDVIVGDEAVLLGQQGAEMISADELAKWADTISYEVVCGIGARVARRILDED